MAAIIFPNSSYFIALAPTYKFDEVLRAFRDRHRCRVHICRGYQEAEEAFRIMSRKLGCFFFTDELDDEGFKAWMQLAGDYQVSGLIFAKAIPAVAVPPGIAFAKFNTAQSENETAGYLEGYMQSLIPKNLDAFAQFCADLVFPSFFSGATGFQRLAYLGTGFDREIVYCTVEGDLMGLCSVKVNLKKAVEAWPELGEEKIIGNLKEAVNQFLGVLTQNLSKVNINPKIGLPTVFDLSKIPQVQTLNYFPSVHLMDPRGLIVLSLGYSHMENQPLFDLSAISPSAPSDEIELL